MTDKGRKFEEQVAQSATKVEAEVKKVIAYLNDEVVPEVRRSSSGGLRTVAEKLRQLADHLDRPGRS